MYRVACLFLPLLALVSIGCSGGDLEKVVVSGTVTYEGEPVHYGYVTFKPIRGTKGPSSGALINDGKYVADGKGGVPVGTHQVSIRAFRPDPNATPAQLKEGASIQYLPPKYDRNSQLELVVTGESGMMTKDFHLEK